jgi:hypothetical protein
MPLPPQYTQYQMVTARNEIEPLDNATAAEEEKALLASAEEAVDHGYTGYAEPHSVLSAFMDTIRPCDSRLLGVDFGSFPAPANVGVQQEQGEEQKQGEGEEREETGIYFWFTTKQSRSRRHVDPLTSNEPYSNGLCFLHSHPKQPPGQVSVLVFAFVENDGGDDDGRSFRRKMIDRCGLLGGSGTGTVGQTRPMRPLRIPPSALQCAQPFDNICMQCTQFAWRVLLSKASALMLQPHGTDARIGSRICADLGMAGGMAGKEQAGREEANEEGTSANMHPEPEMNTNGTS